MIETEFKAYTIASNLTLSSSYTKLIGTHSITTTILYSNIVNENTITDNRFDISSYMARGSYSISKGSGFNALLSFTVPKDGNDSLKTYAIDVSYNSIIK